MTTALLFAIVALLAVGEFLLFGALAEAYRDIRQLREFAGMMDRNAPVDLGPALNEPPSSIGLHPDLDSAVQAVVVYLESRCGTCRSIVGGLAGHIPEGMWLMVVAASREEAFGWLDEGGLRDGTAPAGRVMTASADETERNLGTLITPLAITVEHGRLVRAKTVPSVRQFYGLAPAPMTLAPRMEKGVAS